MGMKSTRSIKPHNMKFFGVLALAALVEAQGGRLTGLSYTMLRCA